MAPPLVPTWSASKESLMADSEGPCPLRPREVRERSPAWTIHSAPPLRPEGCKREESLMEDL
jgi:hypothetical protein